MPYPSLGECPELISCIVLSAFVTLLYKYFQALPCMEETFVKLWSL